MSSSPRVIRSSRPPSASATGSFIRMSMRCARPVARVPYAAHPASSCRQPFSSGACTRRSGTVCLDVINQTWSPMFDLINVFEVFLPQLLLYPNPTDPLNGEAAALMMREPEQYEARIRGTRRASHTARPPTCPHPHQALCAPLQIALPNTAKRQPRSRRAARHNRVTTTTTTTTTTMTTTNDCGASCRLLCRTLHGRNVQSLRG